MNPSCRGVLAMGSMSCRPLASSSIPEARSLRRGGSLAWLHSERDIRLRHALVGATGWLSDPPLALAPSLSADPADRIIVALDGMAPEQALRFAAQVEGLRWVKVGLELFVQAGPEGVAQLREQELRVFLDLKFHDIPATMAGACRRAAALGPN